MGHWNHPKELSCFYYHDHCACAYKLMEILFYILILINNFKLYALITLLRMVNDTYYYLPWIYHQVQTWIHIN